MVDRTGRRFDKYHPPSAEVKNEWNCVSSFSLYTPSWRGHGSTMFSLKNE